MRLYMQSHVFFRKYVKGTDNWAADFMSRMHESHKANVVNTELATLSLLTGDSIEEALRICHKGTQGHGGVRKTCVRSTLAIRYLNESWQNTLLSVPSVPSVNE